MPEVYDSSARKQVRDSGLVQYYADNRARLLRDARRLHRVLADNAQPERMPLRGDVQALLAVALAADQSFLDDLPDHVPDARRSFRKWPAFFAGYIVESDWDDIQNLEAEDA